MQYVFKYSPLTLTINFAIVAAVNAHAETSTVQNLVTNDMPSATLPTINITAQNESANGPVDGISASQVSSATGFDDSILKSTQAVSVVGQQELESIGASNMNQAVDYVAGVTRLEPADKTSNTYLVRGFYNQGAYRDGKKYQVNVFNGQQELYGLERVEVVKGPNSVLNGAMPPGGVINAISKKPYFNNGYEVKAEFGSFNHKQVSADVNQQLTNDFAARLVGVYKDADSFVDYVPNNRTYIAPSVTWQPTDSTKLTLQADYQHIQSKYVYGLPVQGTIYPTSRGKIDRSTFIGEPSFDNYDNKRYTMGYSIEQNITPNLQLKHDLRKMETDIEFPAIALTSKVPFRFGVYNRTATLRKDKSEGLVGSLQAKYDWYLGDSINNVLLAGIDYSSEEHKTDRKSDRSLPVPIYLATGNIDLYNPSYSKKNVPTRFYDSFYSGTETVFQKGGYIQNQLTYDDKVVVLAGVRHSKAKTERIADRKTILVDLDKYGDYDATIGRFGLVYLMDNGLAPYVGVNQSFEVQPGTDKEGNTFEPTEGIQYEFGLRYQPDNKDTLVTVSAYQIDQTNVLETDPSNTYFKKQIGEVSAQGVELEARTQIGDNVNIITAYNYIDARITESVKESYVGKRKGNTPYNQFALWADYRFANFGLPKLKVGAGVKYTGSTLGFFNNAKVPAHTLVDALISYDVSDNLQLSLNAKNLLDEEYVTCSYNCFYGEPLKVTGSIKYKF